MKKSPRIIELKHTKIPLYISDVLRNQIQYLCTRISEVEWSGILFHDIEGNIDDLSTVKLYAQELLLMNKGTKGYTEYDYDGEFTKFLKSKVNGDMKEFVKLLKQKDKNRISHIHSHNNMSVFFSGTDTQELVDNSEFYNYYLSLIVNNKGDMCAKIAYRGTVKSEGQRNLVITYKDGFGTPIIKNEKEDLNSDEEVMFVVDCDIILYYSVDEPFVERADTIIKEAEEREKRKREEHAKKFPKTSGEYAGNSSIYGQWKIPESNHATVNDKQFSLFEMNGGVPSIEETFRKLNIDDKDIAKFVAKVISFNVEDTLGIEANLNQIQQNIDANQINMDEYGDKLEEQILVAYDYCFGALGEGYELLEMICERASDIIDEYEIQFPFVDIISHEFWNASQIELVEEEQE